MDEKLKSTLDKIIRLTQQNAEFDKSLRDAMSLSYPVDNGVISDERINQIYEYCIEKILRKQAEEFYTDFPVKSIIPTLVDDFVRMESFRRKDAFGDFCVSLYQQIENITNKLCESKQLNNIAEKMWGCPAYVVYNKDTEPRIDNRLESTFTIAGLVFPGQNKKTGLPYSVEKSQSSLQAQYASDKIRAIIYFLGYKATMRNVDYENYIEITSLMSDIYQCRNMNHRGNTLTQWEADTINRIIPMKSYYYFKFTGALAQFVNGIKYGVPFIPSIEAYCNSIEKVKEKIPMPKTLGKIELSEKDLKKKRFK